MWKVSKYGVSSGPFFPVVGLERKSPYSIRIRKDTDQKKTPNLDTYEKNKFGIVRL